MRYSPCFPASTAIPSTYMYIPRPRRTPMLHILFYISPFVPFILVLYANRLPFFCLIYVLRQFPAIITFVYI